jgi:hypothetical protein
MKRPDQKGWLPLKRIAVILCIMQFLIAPTLVAGEDSSELETGFRSFLKTYISQIKQRNADYLRKVHPKLPADMYGFFFDLTLGMMKYASEESLSPNIECREYNICKVIWPQPGESWAAQTFILHEGKWLWFDY